MSAFNNCALGYHRRHISSPREHLAAEYFESAKKVGMPLVELFYIPSHSSIANLCKQFYKGKIGKENSEGTENIISLEEPVDPAINSFEIETEFV